MFTLEQVKESAAVIDTYFGARPEVGLILGSGLGPLAEQIAHAKYLSYDAVPHMKPSTAPDHVGRFVSGMLGGKPVICMQGRLHGYEGYSPEEIAYPIYVMREIGVKMLILTNASGGINEAFEVGDLMVIQDHINMTGKSPLTGKNDVALGTRFPDMTFAYSVTLRALAHKAAESLGIQLRQGVYCGVNGPQFETPAEIRMFRVLGADAVGMSTVFEAIAAAHAGLETLGIAMITNMAAGVNMQVLSGAEVNETAEKRGELFRKVITEIVRTR